MSNNNNSLSNSESLIIEYRDFDYITIQEQNGLATRLKFQLMNPNVRIGDVLIVLDGVEILFHGLINSIIDGWGYAADPSGSRIASNTNCQA